MDEPIRCSGRVRALEELGEERAVQPGQHQPLRAARGAGHDVHVIATQAPLTNHPQCVRAGQEGQVRCHIGGGKVAGAALRAAALSCSGTLRLRQSARRCCSARHPMKKPTPPGESLPGLSRRTFLGGAAAASALVALDVHAQAARATAAALRAPAPRGHALRARGGHRRRAPGGA